MEHCRQRSGHEALTVTNREARNGSLGKRQEVVRQEEKGDTGEQE